MLKDDRARGLATEFAGNWLDFRRFEEHNAVDRERFPSFTNELREAMFEEPIRFIDDVIRNDRSVLDLLYGNYTFVNPVLAKHYGMPDVTGGADRLGARGRRRRSIGRGGLLPMAVFLTQNAPGLRTSPVKRGYWVVRRVLGEVIPPPPPGRARTAAGRSEAGSAAARDAGQAPRRTRPAPPATRASIRSAWRSKATARSAKRATKDLAGRPVDTTATFPGGSRGRRASRACRPTSASTGRRISSTISAASCWPTRSAARCSSPMSRLIERMQARLTANGYRFSALVETIVTSPQFLNKRRVEYRNRKVNHDAESTLKSHAASPAGPCFAAPASPWPCRGSNRCPPSRDTTHRQRVPEALRRALHGQRRQRGSLERRRHRAPT